MTSDDRPEPGPKVDKWADLLSPRYHYPDPGDIEGLSRPARRRTRRRSKRAWRAADKAARQEFLAERMRGREPVSPSDRLGCASVLAIVALVLIVVTVVRGCGHDAPPPVPSPSPSTTPVAAGVAPSPAAPSVSPSPSTTPTQVPRADHPADDVAAAWATAFFTFTPTSGQDQDGRINAALDWMTDELAAFTYTDDAVTAGYEAEGTDVVVDDVTVRVPDQAIAPVDTDVRVTRVLDVASRYTAGPFTGQTSSSTYLVTLVRYEDGWYVADYSGAEH